jgi:hypothetical protein
MARFVAAARVRYYFASRAMPLKRRSVRRPPIWPTPPLSVEGDDRAEALTRHGQDM